MVVETSYVTSIYIFQGTRNREQGTGSREQGAGSRGSWIGLFAGGADGGEEEAAEFVGIG